jgi:hypothetical protein
MEPMNSVEIFNSRDSSTWNEPTLQSSQPVRDCMTSFPVEQFTIGFFEQRLSKFCNKNGLERDVSRGTKLIPQKIRRQDLCFT